MPGYHSGCWAMPALLIQLTSFLENSTLRCCGSSTTLWSQSIHCKYHTYSMLLGSTRTGWCFYIFPMSLDHSITSQTKAEAHSSTDWLPQCGGQLRRCVCVSWTSVKRLLDKIPRPLGITTIRCFIQDHAANRNPCCRRGYGIELLMWLRSLTNWMGHIVYMKHLKPPRFQKLWQGFKVLWFFMY